MVFLETIDSNLQNRYRICAYANTTRDLSRQVENKIFKLANLSLDSNSNILIYTYARTIIIESKNQYELNYSEFIFAFQEAKFDFSIVGIQLDSVKLKELFYILFLIDYHLNLKGQNSAN